ncbi:MAG: formylglycine-generating enzyme family protein, partial [Pseudomonadales bacterium]|nr:formylglycine-generating enzyme family protein [Pseudomonadales bacterium]
AARRAAAEKARLVGKLVSIPGRNFRMQEHEVTWSQYQPCIDARACPDNSRSGGDNGWGKGTRPVIAVNWNDVQAYIKWLKRQTGQKFRLPTEAEWEYAARAGSTTKYSWGDSISCSQARYGRRPGGECSNSKDGTVPVKSFAPNRWGLYDMHGNVWEWTQNCWEGDCSKRVLRGGSWDDTPDFVRSAFRLGYSARSRAVGFRLVQDR